MWPGYTSLVYYSYLVHQYLAHFLKENNIHFQSMSFGHYKKGTL